MGEVKLSQLTALVDTREWKKYWDLSPMKMEEATLRTGDYAVKSLPANRLCYTLRIERKEGSDFMKCLTWDRDRFERELSDLMHFPHRIVIVEMSFTDFLTGNYRSQMDPSAAFGTVMNWWQRFNIGFLFAGSREGAIKCAQRFMLKAAQDYHDARLVSAPIDPVAEILAPMTEE